MKVRLVGISFLVAALLLTGVTPVVPAEKAGGIDYQEGVTPQRIPYATGGVGLGERHVMRGIERTYNLKLVFAVTSGEYLASVSVVIEEANGKVLDLVSDGPWLLVKLPEAQYRITATFEGQAREHRVTMGKGSQTVFLHWK